MMEKKMGTLGNNIKGLGEGAITVYATLNCHINIVTLVHFSHSTCSAGSIEKWFMDTITRKVCLSLH